MSNKILFLTGTRADFGKLRPLIDICQTGFDVHIFVTGMHMLGLYGHTWTEVQKRGYKNIHTFINQNLSDTQDVVLAKTIQGLSDCIKELKPDLIVVHGDRVEALAGAITGALNGVLVAHIEGGELSGSIDESIRHAVSKLSHWHFVATDEAQQRLERMGETNIHIIGSPDVDVMLSDLPSLAEAKSWYNIAFDDYYILIFHPVVGEDMGWQARELVEAVAGLNVVAIYPNNDPGSRDIINEISGLPVVFPSVRFEFFLTLLKNAKGIIGNSSCGLMEAPYYGVPTLNIGTRQNNRASPQSVMHCQPDRQAIKNAIGLMQPAESSCHFGSHGSAERFISVLKGNWPQAQKVFHETDSTA